MKTHGPPSAPPATMPVSRQEESYLLRLFVAGTSPRSVNAISNLKKICEEYLTGRYELNVIDLYQQPQLAQSEQIIALPTLIISRKLSSTVHRIIGNLSNTELVLERLDLPIVE